MNQEKRMTDTGSQRQGPEPGKSGAAEAGFVTIAKVTKTQGRTGEVAAMLFTDFPERLATRRRLFALCDAGHERRELGLQQVWLHKGQAILKFAGVDSI